MENHSRQTRPVEDRVDVLQRQLERAREELQRTRNELHETREHMRELVQLDDATGLPNQRAFTERLAQEVRRAGRFNAPLSLVLADVDQYAELVRRHSPDEVDAVLQEIARLMQRNTRSIDYIARYGVHQFGLILPGTGQDGAMLLAERLCLQVEGTGWPTGEVTISCGVTTIFSDDVKGEPETPRDEFDLDDPAEANDRTTAESRLGLAQAYRAMRYSSLSGKNRVMHAFNAEIQRVVPWEDVPAVRIVDSHGDVSTVALGTHSS